MLLWYWLRGKDWLRKAESQKDTRAAAGCKQNLGGFVWPSVARMFSNRKIPNDVLPALCVFGAPAKVGSPVIH